MKKEYSKKAMIQLIIFFACFIYFAVTLTSTQLLMFTLYSIYLGYYITNIHRYMFLSYGYDYLKGEEKQNGKTKNKDN